MIRTIVSINIFSNLVIWFILFNAPRGVAESDCVVSGSLVPENLGRPLTGLPRAPESLSNTKDRSGPAYH